MLLSTLHTLSGMMIVAFWIAKIMLYGYLNFRHDEIFGIVPFLISPGIYFTFYAEPVEQEHILLKLMYNLLLMASGVALMLNVVAGLMIYRK